MDTSTTEFKLVAGDMLVANPKLQDPDFEHSVNVLLEVSSNGFGAQGINISGGQKLEDEPSTPPENASNIEILSGGPLPCALGIIHHNQDGPNNSYSIGNTHYKYTTLEEAIRQTPNHLIVFSGYAGWESGQIEQEVNHQYWRVLPAEFLDEILDLPIEERYTTAAQKVGFDLK